MGSKGQIKEFIISEFIPGSASDEIDNDLDLIGAGIIDSLGVLKLLAFVERTNNITIDADELDFERFKSINYIDNLIKSKKSGKRLL